MPNVQIQKLLCSKACRRHLYLLSDFAHAHYLAPFILLASLSSEDFCNSCLDPLMLVVNSAEFIVMSLLPPGNAKVPLPNKTFMVKAEHEICESSSNAFFGRLVGLRFPFSLRSSIKFRCGTTSA